jgi:hypothetical protein
LEFFGVENMIALFKTLGFNTALALINQLGAKKMMEISLKISKMKIAAKIPKSIERINSVKKTKSKPKKSKPAKKKKSRTQRKKSSNSRKKKL